MSLFPKKVEYPFKFDETTNELKTLFPCRIDHNMRVCNLEKRLTHLTYYLFYHFLL